MLLLNLLILFTTLDQEPKYMATSYYKHQTSTIVERQVRFYVMKDSLFLEYYYNSNNTSREGYVIDHKRVQRFGDHYDISNGQKKYCLEIDNRQNLIILESKKNKSPILTSSKGRYTNQKLITFFLGKDRTR